MVPTPPIYYANSNNTDSTAIYKGKDPNRGLMSGTLGSFNDAPGGIKEEIKEITMSYGVEYWYADIFAIRAGHFRENALKGNRKYFTVGAGLMYNMFGLNFSYLLPSGAGINRNPLSNTLRFSLSFNLDDK